MLIDCKADESSLSSSSSSYGTSRGPLGPFLLAFDPPPLLLGRVEDEDVAVADEAAAALVTVRTKEATAFLATPVTMPSLLTVALVEDPRLIIFGLRAAAASAAVVSELRWKLILGCLAAEEPFTPFRGALWGACGPNLVPDEDTFVLT